MIVPIVDTVSSFVDQRIRVTEVKAESTLTRDAVPVFVDAIVFWLVWNAEKSILEVQDFSSAIQLSAQTGLRESIGRHMLTDMVTDRESLGRELQKILDAKTNPWGDDGAVGGDPRRADSAGRWRTPCRARRRRSGSGTRASFWARPRRRSARSSPRRSEMYRDNPIALHLRAMNMLYEAIKEKGSMVIVPSSAVETMGLGGMMGMASIKNTLMPPEPAAEKK